MLVASHIEFGDQAVAAVLPQIIGTIDTAIGSGTLRRAGDAAVEVMVGDPVHQGDVIETATDGQVGIRLIDGTLFMLSRGTRVVLDEFVCDPDGASHSALLVVTRGSFAFIAGRMARNGSLRVDTPLGSIRGRTHAGGFGMLSLTALTFATMSDVQAADPNATFLDDDSITYKDLEHGTFELWTKEAIPRHIIIEDPGETVELTQRGSSISVNQVANSPARMAELQAAQQAVLANFATGYGPNGSSTPSYYNSPLLQPINFTQTDSSTTPNQLSPLESAPNPIFYPVIPPPPPPVPPTLNTATGPTLVDTIVFDTFTASAGKFVASSSNSATLTFSIAGGTAGNTVLDGVTYDVSQTGHYGTLYVDSTTGDFIYVPDNNAVNALKAPTTESFTITVSDGTLSASQIFTITIDGANDAAVISGSASGAVAEAGGLANAAQGTPTVTGTLTDTDVDDPANTFTVVGSTKSDKGYGSFTMTAAGVWVYTLDNTNPTVQGLNANSIPLTDTFTVTTVDGTPQVVTVTITGSNDASVISGTASGSVTEAGGVANATPGTPTATGTLTDTDVDNTANAFTPVGSTKSDKGYGSFTMTAAGVWVYTLDNTNPTVQGLNANSIPLTDTFTVTTVDGTPQVVTVTITGSNDAAIIAGTATGSVIEADGSGSGTPISTGTLTDTDVDNTANAFTPVGSTKSDKGYGSFTMTAAGVWVYTLDDNNSVVQALDTGDTLTDTFKVTTVDGTTQLVTITIHGSNDASVISGTASGSVTEAGGVANATPGTPTATGTLTDTDVDNTANAFTPVGSTKSDKGYGSFTMTAAGVWVYTLDNTNPTVQGLNANSIPLTDTFTVTTVDGTPQVVTVTITGSNDASVISGTASGSVTEAGGVANATPGTPTATGTLTDTDVDNTANAFTPVGSTKSDKGYGSFTMTAAGVWVYTLDNTNPTVQGLNANSIPLTDTFTVTTVDGTPQVVTVTITGSNDASVISGTASGSVTEAGGVANATPGTPTATGTLTDTDVDNTANAFTPVGSTKSDKSYGSFTMTAAGVWVYTLDNTNPTVQGLNANSIPLTDTFTVTTVDGTPQVVTVTITGSNDASVISGTASGSVTEAGGVANATPGTPTATGTLTDTDVDNTANAFTPVGSTKSDKGYGSFTMTAAGVWVYTLDNTNPTVQGLNANSIPLTDTFTVTTVDGTPQVVTVTITGSNDAAIIAGTATGSVIEADGSGSGTPISTGTLTDTDVDNTANAFTPVGSTKSDKGYGSFTMTAAGVWVYTLDDNNSVVQALDTGDTLTDTFKVTTVDGTTQLVTITIHGSSDADPNDFDNLAMRDHVTTEPPFVYGTPLGDNIAGGGNESQTVYAGKGNDTVNGTGVNDLLYSGSGNDTIKGNGGNDTLYGGSGSDDINGNNGDDTIIGGFGGDSLTGSNGNDIFVYLAVADSNSAQFDTITDFQSGSDKINLMAFGALAFMALSPSATTVPPHTLAWIYDSASNETIVYVNPTDQTLDIGDSSLVEIHLQGVTSVAESDFVHQPAAAAVAAAAAADAGIDPALLVTTASDGTVLTTATADASVDATVSESARVTDFGWTMPPDERFSFHFVRDRIDSVGSVGLTSFGEARAYATEDSDGDAVTTLASVSSIDHPHGHATLLMEDHFTFDHGPIHAGASATVTADFAVTSTSVTVDHALGVATATAELQLAGDDTPGNSAGHSQSQHASHAVPESASAAAEVQLAEQDAPGNSAGHSQSQHASHAAPENASASAEVQLAEQDAPGNSAGHSQSQHASHAVPENASAAAEVQLAEQDAPGNSADHSQSQDASHAVPENASASAEVQLAEQDAPGNSAGHSQSQHASHAVPENASASAEVQLAEQDAPGNSAGHSQSQHASHTASESASSASPPEANLAAAVPEHPAPANAAEAVMAAAADPGDSFPFKDDIASPGHSAAVDVADAGHGHASGHHDPAAIAEIEPADLSLVEQSPLDSANVAHQHANHAVHDLIV